MASGVPTGWRLGLAAALACSACDTETTTTADAPGTAGSSSEQPSSCTDVPSPGPSPIRRLNRFEYDNTVLALLGDASQPATLFPPEESGNGFGNDATALSASQLLVERYEAAARQLAASATTQRWAKLVGCEPSAEAEEQSCAQAFIESFGQRAFRGPLSPDEVARLLGVFDTSRATLDFRGAIADVIAVMLQSPRFLYRVELGDAESDGSNMVRLTPYEMASRLSYLFLASMPDAELLERAGRGELQTPDSVRVQAQRLLADAGARRMLQHFHSTLFGLSGLDFLSRNSEAYPTFTPDLGPLLRQETETFIDHVVWQGDAKLSTLMSGSYTFLNARLAAFYGVTGPSSDAFERVELDPTQRAGFLTQAGPMAALTPGSSTNPVIRGVYVRSRLFCDPPPDPPPDLMVEEPAANVAPTARQRFELHRSEATCNACHGLIDPLGLPFENYDGLGQWRDTENGEPIDASGDLVGTDVAGAVAGPVEMVRRIAQSEDARRCYANQWMSYAYGRGFSAEDACTRERVEAEFLRADGGIHELLLALTQTDTFLYRSVEAP